MVRFFSQSLHFLVVLAVFCPRVYGGGLRVYDAFSCEGQQYHVVDCGGEGDPDFPDRTYCCNGDAYAVAAYCPASGIPQCCDSVNFEDCLGNGASLEGNSPDMPADINAQRQRQWLSRYSEWIFDAANRNSLEAIKKDAEANSPKVPAAESNNLRRFKDCIPRIKDDVEQRLGLSISASGAEAGSETLEFTSNGGGGGGNTAQDAQWVDHYSSMVFEAQMTKQKDKDSDQGSLQITKEDVMSFQMSPTLQKKLMQKYDCEDD